MSLQALEKKLCSMSIEDLCYIVAALNSDMRDESSLVFTAALDLLEGKMPANDFERFCNNLYAAL